MEVCWQVPGIRKDPWALHNPLHVEEHENHTERGNYLHPKLYSQPESSTIGGREEHHTPRPGDDPGRAIESLRPVCFERGPSHPLMCGQVCLLAPLPAIIPMCPPATWNSSLSLLLTFAMIGSD